MTLRTDIVRLLAQRRETRRTRRARKTRYRAPRFDNRRRPEGWIAPSVGNRVQTHLKLIEKMHRILPVSRTVIEVAQFDLQLIKNPDIAGEQYQQGKQMGFWNTREYVLCRDGHRCRHCKGRSKDPVLNVHHIESRQTGGDAPGNLITLCETCHKAYHKGEIELKASRSIPLRDAAVMNIMRWELYRRAKALYDNVGLTYGYITKHTRINAALKKSHRTDARCISGNPTAAPAGQWFKMRQVRRHDRSLHVFTPAKGGKRRSASASHWIGSSRLQRYDAVRWNGTMAFISGSTGGRPVLRDIDWKLITPTASVNQKTVTFMSRKHGNLLIQEIR